VLGLNAATIASAFLMSPTAMGQRLVRAKTKIRQAGIPFRHPEREELAGRLDTVLDAIYAAFHGRLDDPGGADVARRDLAEEALFWQLVTELLPESGGARAARPSCARGSAAPRAAQRGGRVRAVREQDPAL